MSGTCKKWIVFVCCYLAISQLHAQVTPAPQGNDARLAPRPLKQHLQPIRPGMQLMPQERDYAWWMNRIKQQGRVQTATRMVRKPTAIANLSQLPAPKPIEWYRQRLQRPYSNTLHPSTPATRRPASTLIPPNQRTYQWWQQQLDASRQRANLPPRPGSRH